MALPPTLLTRLLILRQTLPTTLLYNLRAAASSSRRYAAGQYGCRIAACRSIHTASRLLQEAAKTSEPDAYEFQAETRMLLDIVAKSLYSEKEVFVRELISNASDAIEKARYFALQGRELDSSEADMKIHITTDKYDKTLIIQDSGIGMTKEELIDNLGTIARSGSKAFIQQLQEGGTADPQSIIGQFGVGFYSAFMVAERVDVYTKSRLPGSIGYCWSSDGYNFLAGILSAQEQVEKEEIAKLIMYDSSAKPAGEKVTLPEYIGRMADNQKDIYYLAAPSRELAETSPYFEALKKRNVEVLFCYEPYDEVVLMQLREFTNRKIISVEKEMRQDKDAVDYEAESGLRRTQANELMDWLKTVLSGRCWGVKATPRLESHPCAVTVEEMGAARHFVRTQFTQIPEETRYSLLQPQLEINPSHPIIMKLNELRINNPRLAELTAKQLFSNAMVLAGLVEDPRIVLSSMNELLQLALEKH
nr:heat shock protein 75 kDa, mitochondrial-like [Cherax quadricarinatus]